VEIKVIEDLSPIFEPSNGWPGFPFGHADEGDFVAQFVFEIEMRGFHNSSSLKMVLKILFDYK